MEEEKEKVFAVYKPKGPTSAAFLSRIKKYLEVKKIGHAGTLDPLARGVLVVGVDGGTKEMASLVKKEKEYLAKIRLGVTSTTDDEEGDKEEIKVSKKPTREEVVSILLSFEGEILQTPPAYSAIKIKGQTAYKLARRGEKPDLKPRPVLIKKIELMDYDWPYLTIRAITGPGVYIRSLARDIGKKLETGGYLADLERTRVGEFTVRDSLRI